MAMPYYDGITLKKWLKDLGAPPSGKWLRAIAWPLTQALAVLHEQGCMHRDVAPDNILMLYDRSGGNYLEQVPRPVLLWSSTTTNPNCCRGRGAMSMRSARCSTQSRRLKRRCRKPAGGTRRRRWHLARWRWHCSGGAEAGQAKTLGVADA